MPVVAIAAVDRGMTRPADVLCLPDWREGNPYQALLQQSLAALGERVEFSGIPSGAFALVRSWLRAGRPKVVHLHWSDELIGPSIWPRSVLVRGVRRRLMALDVWLLKRLGARVVWTIHNLVAHASVNREHELRARRTLIAAVDRVIVHSAGALRQIRQAYAGNRLPDERVSIIPHGNYDGCYPANPSLTRALAADWRLDPATVTILFFGTLKPYKGLERLLAAFARTTRHDLRLIVAGKPADASVRAAVESVMRGDPRVFARMEFIAEEDVRPLFDLADVVAIPFERALTSGSSVLAMTFGKALILPEFARELEFAAEQGCLFFDCDESLPPLLESLSKARLQAMGHANRRLADDRSWAGVARRTRDAYGRAEASERSQPGRAPDSMLR